MLENRTDLRRVGGIPLRSFTRLAARLTFQRPPVGLQVFPVENGPLLYVSARRPLRALGAPGQGLVTKSSTVSVWAVSTLRQLC